MRASARFTPTVAGGAGSLGCCSAPTAASGSTVCAPTQSCCERVGLSALLSNLIFDRSLNRLLRRVPRRHVDRDALPGGRFPLGRRDPAAHAVDPPDGPVAMDDAELVVPHAGPVGCLVRPYDALAIVRMDQTREVVRLRNQLFRRVAKEL